MEIIAIEGLDKSGKATQTRLLGEFLKTLGLKVVTSEFHRYDTPTGKLIQQWLYGEYDVDQKTIELIMTADKQAQQKWFDKLEESGVDVLILDRYIASQQVYSLASGISSSWTYDLQSYLTEPTLQILIDIPVEVSMDRKGKHGDNDRYESDKMLLERVHHYYHRIFGAGNIVDGTKPVDEVHMEVVRIVRSHMFRR